MAVKKNTYMLHWSLLGIMKHVFESFLFWLNMNWNMMHIYFQVIRKFKYEFEKDNEGGNGNDGK